MLEYRNTKLAVVEAKAWEEELTLGVAQAKDYAGKLAVRFTYYEYWERDRLTDEEWKNKLDGSDAPAPPDWLVPYMAR